MTWDLFEMSEMTHTVNVSVNLARDKSSFNTDDGQPKGEKYQSYCESAKYPPKSGNYALNLYQGLHPTDSRAAQSTKNTRIS